MSSIWRKGKQPRRQVALKVLKSGWASKDARSRFIGEYGALARMEHSAIARYYEAGETDDKRPWYALEYCPGEPIMSYCRNNKRSLDDQLHLFIAVLHGITHAHSKAVIHRDIKPSNILVFNEDGNPTVRIIDFGIARLLGEGHLGSETIFTEDNRVIGTPCYMAPEITNDANKADTRSDVWALGVVLYEMLTGKLPFGDPHNDPLENFKAIRERDPRIPSHDSLLSLSRIARLSGDLDAIALKALEKDPDKRYQSAAAFTADIEAFLENRPVTARHQTPLYRASKFIKRNRLAVSVGALFFVTIAVSFYFNIRSRLKAEAEADRKQRVISFLSDTYSAVNPFGGKEDMTVIQAINLASGDINKRFASDPFILTEIHKALAEMYLGRGTLDRATHHAGELKRVAPTKAQAIEADLLKVLILQEQGKHKEAETLCSSLLNRTSKDSEQWLASQLFRSDSISEQGRYNEAEEGYQSILPALRKTFGEGHFQVLRAMRGLTITKMDQGQYAEALEQFEQVLDIEKRTLGNDHPQTLETLNSLARTHMFLGNHERSLAILRSVLAARVEQLGAGNPNTLKTRINIMHTLYRANRYVEAKTFGEETIALHDQYLGAEAQETIKAQNNLALVYEALGENDRAATLYQTTYDTQARVYGREDKLTLSYGHNLGSFYISLGRHGEAEALLKSTWEARKAVYGPDHIRSLFTCFTLGECYVAMGEFNAALPLLEEAYKGILLVHDSTHEFSVIFGGFLGYTRCRLGQGSELLYVALKHSKKIEPKYKKKLEVFEMECKKTR